jgi:hypothetical protein
VFLENRSNKLLASHHGHGLFLRVFLPFSRIHVAGIYFVRAAVKLDVVVGAVVVALVAVVVVLVVVVVGIRVCRDYLQNRWNVFDQEPPDVPAQSIYLFWYGREQCDQVGRYFAVRENFFPNLNI